MNYNYTNECRFIILMGGLYMMGKKKVSLLEVRPGMVLANNIFSQSGNLLIGKGTPLNDKLIALLRMNSVYIVYIQLDENIFGEGHSNEKHGETVQDTPAFEKFEKVYSQTVELYSNTINQIVYQNKSINVDELLSQVDTIVKQGSGSFQLMNALNSMKESDDVTYVHSVNVALISNIIGKWMKLPSSTLELLTVSGLLHDIGKLKLPHMILNKTGPLTPSETVEMQKHPIHGYNIVKDQPIDQRIKNVVLMHHERGDGSGYPFKSRFSNISKEARIVAVADVFDAMTSNRCYRNAINPFDVIHMMEVDGYLQFDSEVVVVFLNNILETYIHSKVILDNGQTGEIVFLNKKNPSRPIIKVNGACIDLLMHPEVSIVSVGK